MPDRTLQLRRIEFEKRRMRRELRRRKRQPLRGGVDDERQLWRDYRVDAERLRFESWRRASAADQQRSGQSWPFIEPPPGDSCDDSQRQHFISHRYFHPTVQQPFNHNTISAFFPSLERRDSTNSDKAHHLPEHRNSDEENSSYPSLPPPPPPLAFSTPPPSCPSTPTHRALAVTPRRERTSALSQQAVMEEEEKEEWKVPRLDLDDIWSDATLPGSSCGGAAADLSLASTQEQLGQQQRRQLRQQRCSTPTDVNPHRSPVAARENQLSAAGSSSVRSVGCDTGDLVLPRAEVASRRLVSDWGGGGDYLPTGIQTSRELTTSPAGPLSASRVFVRRAYSADQMAEINSILR